MKLLVKQMTLIALFSVGVNSAHGNEIDKNTQQQAKQKIQTFAKQLKGQLLQAVKSGGFEAGIEVCEKQAPIIAKQLSTDGWQVSRTSLKARNSNNQPLPWQRKVLEQFEHEQDQGKPVNQLLFVKQDAHSFKMMKAIPTGELCLACHGKNIAEPIQQKVQQLYPNDMATGFAVGDIRGAFVVEKETSKS